MQVIVSTKTNVENKIKRLTVQIRSAQTNLAINDTENYVGMDKSVHAKKKVVSSSRKKMRNQII